MDLWLLMILKYGWRDHWKIVKSILMPSQGAWLHYNTENLAILHKQGWFTTGHLCLFQLCTFFFSLNLCTTSDINTLFLAFSPQNTVKASNQQDPT